MAWKPYQDQENRAYSGILTTLFPEQTKTLPRIIVWSLIFLLDLIVGIGGAMYFGLIPIDKIANKTQLMICVCLLLAAIVGIFWLQGVIWFAIVKLIKKRT